MTPVQELIKLLEYKKQNGIRFTSDILNDVKRLLPKEKALISQAWDAGIEAFCFENGSEFVDGKPPNKTEFLNQLYPKP